MLCPYYCHARRIVTTLLVYSSIYIVRILSRTVNISDTLLNEFLFVWFSTVSSRIRRRHLPRVTQKRRKNTLSLLDKIHLRSCHGKCPGQHSFTSKRRTPSVSKLLETYERHVLHDDPTTVHNPLFVSYCGRKLVNWSMELPFFGVFLGSFGILVIHRSVVMSTMSSLPKTINPFWSHSPSVDPTN